MEEQKRAKATKPYWVTIVLPAWGAEREKPGFLSEPLPHEGTAQLQAEDFKSH